MITLNLEKIEEKIDLNWIFSYFFFKNFLNYEFLIFSFWKKWEVHEVIVWFDFSLNIFGHSERSKNQIRISCFQNLKWYSFKNSVIRLKVLFGWIKKMLIFLKLKIKFLFTETIRRKNLLIIFKKLNFLSNFQNYFRLT